MGVVAWPFRTETRKGAQAKTRVVYSLNLDAELPLLRLAFFLGLASLRMAAASSRACHGDAGAP